MTYAESVQYLRGLGQFGMKPGLNRAIQLAAAAGNPQERLRFIHVAGTNGKGSTCAMLDSIYRISGKRVGLFTSPHLVSFTERIQISGVRIAPERLTEGVARLRQWMRPMAAHDSPTFFECATVLALDYFAEQRCDVVVWETGLGGRLDATNIVLPLASVITSIDLDHQQWLGGTLEAIAAEKAGIFKQGVPAISGVTQPGPREVIRRLADQHHCLLVELRSGEEDEVLRGTEPSLRGPHQRRNAALACLTVRALQAVLPVQPGAIQQGLEKANWPGRFQRIERPGQTVWVDGAHNPAGAAALVEALAREPLPAHGRTLVFGALSDKDWPAMIKHLQPAFTKIVIVPVASERGTPPEIIAATMTALASRVSVTACESLAEALAMSRDDREIVICGSLYLVGEALRSLGALEAPPDPVSEAQLNDWRGPATT